MLVLAHSVIEKEIMLVDVDKFAVLLSDMAV